jgi:3-dehydroquinate dehydratase-2
VSKQSGPTKGSQIAVMHGVNFDVLELRDTALYGGGSLPDLERTIEDFAREVGLRASCFQTNSEREYVEHLHALRGSADGVVLNPGAWTHYAWAIHDALDIAALPAVEVHLSDIHAREPWRELSVIGDLCIATFSGLGVEGYRLALARLAEELERA